MMTKECKGCRFNKSWCNRLVVAGGFGMNDRVASDYLREDAACEYKEEGKSTIEKQPNLNNWAT